uniref:Uncharacterized protein n=1 Tax=Helianthus annuus TaxID=4232 RepID=A0A251TLV0_HELAN
MNCALRGNETNKKKQLRSRFEPATSPFKNSHNTSWATTGLFGYKAGTNNINMSFKGGLKEKK